MTGVLFIVNVPQKDHEEELRKKENSNKIIIEKDKYEKTSKIIHELKGNKKFGSIKSTIESYTQDDDSIIISKCKSTDCLHANDKEAGLYKCRSENTLSENNVNVVDEPKSYIKSSWEEIKQVIKPRRNKLKISKGRGIDILGAFHWDTPLETILSEIIARLEIRNASWSTTNDNKFWKVIFSLEAGNLCEELLQVLRTFGIGSRHQSSVSVIPCALYYKANYNSTQAPVENHCEYQSGDSAWSRFSSSVRARINLAQVLHDVKKDATLTFDWLFLLIVAAFVAALGLVENSTVILVASMLISPLMGPITAGTLGTAVKDRSLQQMGVIHELLGLFLSLVIGFIFGMTICAVDERYGVGDWPTYEMMSRCEIRSLWVGVLVAIPSGAGVALAVLSENTASLVGVAISASLLPPAVNAGLLWAMALVHLIFMNDDTRWTGIIKTSYYSNNPATELAVLGTVSLCLTLVNIICIFLAGVTVYKVKEVCPLERRDLTWWRANHNLMQASKRSQSKQESSVAWDIYNKWCNDTNKTQKDLEKKELAVGLIQSNTVTYRRHPSEAQRQRAQNIEAYCLRKAQMGENYLPLNSDGENWNSKEVNVCDKDLNVQHGDNDDDANRKSDRSLDFGSNHSFYNLGFEDLENDAEKSESPVIEPSSNFTVDPKNCVLILGSKSFNV